MLTKNLTVRLDPETRLALSLIADRELRPMSNQIVIFVRQGIERYLEENKLAITTEEEFDDNGVFIANYQALTPRPPREP